MNNADYLLDGMLSGTGVRDVANGGYVASRDLGLSAALQARIAAWQRTYEEVHFNGFAETDVAEVDRAGQELAASVRAERPDLRVGYYSNGMMQRLE